MIRIFVAGFAAVLIGAAAIMSGVASSGEAHSTPASAKGARADMKPSIGSQCSQQSWPYYESGCLRNTVGASRDARPVRMVTTDRIAQ